MSIDDNQYLIDNFDDYTEGNRRNWFSTREIETLLQGYEEDQYTVELKESPLLLSYRGE
jgi:hypothetical protein